jgi:hypothetical protein
VANAPSDPRELAKYLREIVSDPALGQKRLPNPEDVLNLLTHVAAVEELAPPDPEPASESELSESTADTEEASEAFDRIRGAKDTARIAKPEGWKLASAEERAAFEEVAIEDPFDTPASVAWKWDHWKKTGDIPR